MGGSFKDKPVATVAEGLNVIRQFIQDTTGGYNQSFLMNNNGELYVRMNQGQPCQGGEMRTYGKSHGKDNCTRPDDPRPGDLFCPFPDGNPIAVGIPFTNRGGDKVAYEDVMTNVIFDADFSPWNKLWQGFGIENNYSFELQRSKTGIINGFIQMDTNVDSTLLVNLCRMMNSELSGHIPTYSYLLKTYPTIDKLLAFIVSNIITVADNKFHVRPGGEHYSAFSGSPSFKRLFTGDYVDLTGGTFYNRYAYNRPEIDFIFGKNVDNIDKWARDLTKGKVGYDGYDIKHLEAIINHIKELATA